MKKILITGSSGTIGTRLFEVLLDKGYDVVGFDKKENVWHQRLNKLTIIGDLLDKKDLKKIPKGFDMVVHLAANARVHDLVVEPSMALDNIISTFNVLEHMREHAIPRILFASSREVYGNRKKSVASEAEVDITLCESPYAASKISDELFIYSYAKCYQTEYIICRFSNVYGMYDESERFVPLMIRRMKRNQDVEIFGKDKMLDFTYIDDCISGVVACIEKFDKVKNNVFNIAPGHGEKLVDVANLIKKELDSKAKLSFGPVRTGEVVKYVADISKAKKMLKYAPKTLIKEGIEKSIKWYLDNTNF